MKAFNASQLSHDRREILKAAKEEGAIIQSKNTNGDVLEEFLIIHNDPLRRSGHSIQMVRDMTEA